ncbi:MAG: ATP-binding cassette domain-containing protein [Spirochaetales bacterium]|jgi:oligopeptide/dipeptide ABC transporter ATP-binding protein|nr:ATP-binding cassette domain-containing protein [Spirochaetales bacterium]
MHELCAGRENGGKPFIDVKGLVKHYPLKAGLFSTKAEKVHAVNGVSLSIERGKTHGLVGESGSGKTTTARLLLRVMEPDAGEFSFGDTQNVFTLEPGELKKIRRRMQYIFQDPYASLNPKMQVRDIVTEPLRYREAFPRGRGAGEEVSLIAGRLLERVGLSARDVRKYPHEFSGGQRQRLCIARALAGKPEFIVCDEPVSSLDVSIQSQILNLLLDIQKEEEISCLFIAHNLAVVFYLSDYVSVMYAGRIVEASPSRVLAAHARHPYTRLLLEAMPGGAKKEGSRASDSGETPSLIHLPRGCAFSSRCPLKKPACAETSPPLVEKEPGRFLACFEA